MLYRTFCLRVINC